MPTAAWQQDIREAFVAIGKHNLEDTKISPRNDPLALLLVLCDHLQEWDRPHLEAVRLRRSFSTSLQRPGQVATVAKTIVHKLQTNLRWKSGRVHLPPGQALRLTLWYKDAGVEHFEPALIWCQNTYNFQRIDFEDWPVDLEIVLEAIHPRQKLSGGIQLWEMDLFEDFARSDEECAGIMAWFRTARDGTPGLSYQREDNPKDGFRETFLWTLKSGGFLPSRRNPDGTDSAIDKFPAGLYRRYTLWKEQRLREIRLRKR